MAVSEGKLTWWECLMGTCRGGAMVLPVTCWCGMVVDVGDGVEHCWRRQFGSCRRKWSGGGGGNDDADDDLGGEQDHLDKMVSRHVTDTGWSWNGMALKMGGRDDGRWWSWR